MAPHTYTNTVAGYTVAEKKLTVAAGDYYLAYRNFCRVCRIVGHSTSSCPRRPARTQPGPATAPNPFPPLPPAAVWPDRRGVVRPREE